jgi:hypothetical protein
MDDFRSFIRKIDPRSWPAFFMFLIVLVAAGGLNYLGMEPVTGGFLAVAIALFFGFGVLSWHIVESRTDDSKYQEDVAKAVKWINVILDGLLIILNLFRADLRTASLLDGLTWWDGLAFAIIGLSASSHMIGYLLWTENDPRRALNKERERGLHDISMKRQKAADAGELADAELSAMRFVADEEIRLRKVYYSLDAQELNRVVAEMKRTAMAEFKKKQQEPVKQNNQQLMRPAYTETTEKPELKADKGNPQAGERKQ